MLTDDEWKQLDAHIVREIEEAVTFAKESPFPPVEAALEDVFAG